MTDIKISNNRLEWVDAMRGFSMILVVFGHVMLYMGIGVNNTFLSSILITFRMPLFFFVSGFFSYRLREWWSPKRIGEILQRKFNAQIITAVIFFVIYQHFIANQCVNFERGFQLYWFTIVLFQMYLIYTALSVIDKITGKNLSIKIMILMSITSIVSLIFIFHETRIAKILSWYNLLYYFQYYTFGIICSKYRDSFFKLLTKNQFKTWVIILFISTVIGWSFEGNIHKDIHFLNRFELCRFLSLIIVIFMFYENAEKLSRRSFISKSLRYVGKRTLDIYYIHYFFLPDLKFLSQYLSADNMISIQVLIVTIITIIVTILSLIVSSILRSSDTLKWFMFGVRTKRT